MTNADHVCNTEISCVLTPNVTVTEQSVETCQRPTFDQYTIISLAILLVCVFYVRFVINVSLVVAAGVLKYKSQMLYFSCMFASLLYKNPLSPRDCMLAAVITLSK